MRHPCLREATQNVTGIGQKRLDSGANNRHFGGKPSRSGFEFMPDQAQIRTEGPPDMIPLCPCAQIARCPVFRVTIWGVHPEDQDATIAFEMHACPAVPNVAHGYGTITAPIWVDQPIGRQPGQPLPAKGADLFEVGQTAVLAVEADILRGELPLLGGLEHRAKVVIFSQAIMRRINQAH